MFHLSYSNIAAIAMLIKEVPNKRRIYSTDDLRILNNVKSSNGSSSKSNPSVEKLYFNGLKCVNFTSKIAAARSAAVPVEYIMPSRA